MPGSRLVKAERQSDPRLDRLERAIGSARWALAWERIWPLLVPVLTVLGLYVALAWLGYWRLGGDWLRLGSLALLVLALAWSLVRIVRSPLPGRAEAMRRVEQLSGLPHRPARGLADRISPVADDADARALWAANQQRLYASLTALRAGMPRPQMALRDRQGWRFVVPLLLVLGFAVAWGEWLTRLQEGLAPVAVPAAAVTARVDVWVDPPAYTRQAPVFLSRGEGQEAAGAIRVPEGSRLTVRTVSREPVQVALQGDGDVSALAAAGETRAADSGDTIRTYETALDRDVVLAVTDGEGTATYPLDVIEDRPPTVARGPVTVNRSGSFSLAFDVADDYGVAEGSVEFRPAVPQAEDARPLVEAPQVQLRLERAQGRDGTARADARLESHPYAGTEVLADTVVRDAAGQEGRPGDSGLMLLPERPFYNPVARALVEQRRILALDANSRRKVASALDALTIAPEKLGDAGVYLGLRVGYHRLLAARSDDDLRGMVDYLWDMARAIEDGDLSDAEQRLEAARDALQQALEEGASEEEIARLMDELRQAMNEFLESYASEMAQRGMQDMPMPGDQDMQTLTQQDLQQMMDRIEDLARLGNTEAAQELLSQMQQMLDNLQMAQPGQTGPGNEEAMRQMDELARIMREQQQMMDDTFELNQGRRPSDRQQDRQGRQGDQQPLTPEELAALMQQLQEGQGQLQERLQQLLEQMQQGQGQQGEQGQPGQGGEGSEGADGQGGQGGEGSRALGRAGRAMGDAFGSLGEGEADSAYGHQGEALEALREGLQGMMQQMFANQPGQPGQQMGGNPSGQRDPLGRPQRTQGPDFGQNVRVPDEIDVERARQILEAIRDRLGERFRPRFELDYLERLLGPD